MPPRRAAAGGCMFACSYVLLHWIIMADSGWMLTTMAVLYRFSTYYEAAKALATGVGLSKVSNRRNDKAAQPRPTFVFAVRH